MGLWDFDLGGRSAAEIDESAGPIQPGYYRTKVESATIKPEDGSVAIKFRVCYGPMAGKTHTEYLKSPQMASSDYARDVAVKKAVVYLRRLGVISPDHSGPISNPDWSKAVSDREIIIHVIHRKWDANPVKGLQAGERTEIDFAGVWPMDHRDVAAFKPEIRGALGLPGGSAPAAAPAAAVGAAASGHAAPRATPAELAKSLWGE